MSQTDMMKSRKEFTTGATRILIVEDEPKVVYLVKKMLTAAGYDVVTASNGERGIELAVMDQPDLVILDILLPGAMDGYEVAKRLHEFSDVPIVMLTGKVRESDILRGFEVGADDYITKPFSTRQLLVRVKAVLRRYQQGLSAVKKEEEIICGDVRIDLVRRQVTVNAKPIHLTHTEYRLLYELASHPNQVLLHEHLLTQVWGPEFRDDLDYLKAYIHSLRKKIEADPASPKIIIRCPGVGYSLVFDENRS